MILEQYFLLVDLLFNPWKDTFPIIFAVHLLLDVKVLVFQIWVICLLSV